MFYFAWQTSTRKDKTSTRKGERTLRKRWRDWTNSLFSCAAIRFNSKVKFLSVGLRFSLRGQRASLHTPLPGVYSDACVLKNKIFDNIKLIVTE